MVGILAASISSATHASSGQVLVTDPADMGDPSGDIRSIGAYVIGDYMFFTMAVDGVAGPSTEQSAEGTSNRYYYHWLLDTDNNPATGRSNAEYEGNSTGVTTPIGAERVIMIGWRDGKREGIEVYDPLDDDNVLASNFPALVSGNSLTAIVPLSALGISQGQTVALAAFQEGASNGWAVDWTESAQITVDSPSTSIASVEDPADHGDSSGDIRNIGIHTLGDHVVFWMSVEGTAGPSIENTPEGKSNRYYYHWLMDTDNNPATGRSNAEYEGNATGVVNAIGGDRVIMIGWRNGKREGIEVYDPLDDDNVILENFPIHAGGNTLLAVVPMSALGVIHGQTVSIAAFQEGASDGWAVDWTESAELTLEGPDIPMASISDPSDMGDSSGDIRQVTAHVVGDELHLSMTVDQVAGPSTANTPEGMSNRYYYHWLLDTDNNPATGRSNAEYEGNATNLERPIGTEIVIMVGWRNGKPDGFYAYNPLDEENPLLTTYRFQASGNTLSAVIPLADLNLVHGQTIAVSAFQEGASNGWAVDWVESEELTLVPGTGDEAPVASVDDPEDMGDSSGDIKRIEATVDNGDLVLRMSVYGIILPSIEQTPEGMVNRYYYHWLLDTDNNPATGRSNAEYEGNSTGVNNPIGADLVIMVGWRNGATDGTEVYDPLDEDNPLLSNFDLSSEGDMMEVRIPLESLGLVLGQTIAVSGFQEGASNGWIVDWVESAELTLSEGSLPGIRLNTSFEGDAFGFLVVIEDDASGQADPDSIEAALNGMPVNATVSKSGGITRVEGVHSSLLPPNSTHTLSLSVLVDGELESRDFVFPVGNYTVLPASSRLATVDTSNKGFLTYVTQISGFQTSDGTPHVHNGIADMAEQQLRGEFLNEFGTPYYNEANINFEAPSWKGDPIIIEGPINWFELAPGTSASLNFPDDDGIPNMFSGQAGGMVVEFMTYLHLAAGNHKLGVYSETGHKATAGFSPGGPLLSLFDNSGEIERIPTYFARNQFFDVVATQDGYYPIRILWFHNRNSQEDGAILELFSVREKQLHLLNDSTNPLSISAYRAGILLTPGVEEPEVGVIFNADGSISIEWTGELLGAPTVDGPWTSMGDASASPMTVQPTENARYFRSSSAQ